MPLSLTYIPLCRRKAHLPQHYRPYGVTVRFSYTDLGRSGILREPLVP